MTTQNILSKIIRDSKPPWFLHVRTLDLTRESDVIVASNIPLHIFTGIGSRTEKGYLHANYMYMYTYTIALAHEVAFVHIKTKPKHWH